MLQCIIIEKCKAKAIQADLTIFTHIPAYSGMFTLIQTQSNIFRNYSSIFRTLCNPGVFLIVSCSEPEAYSEPCYIQNPEIFSTLPNIYDRAFCENN